MNRFSLAIFFPFLFALGCGEPTHEFPQYDVEAIFNPAAYAPEWNDRNADIYRFLLSKLDAPDADRVYFITNTPLAHWGDDPNWSIIPKNELDKFANASLYQSANDAHLRSGLVLQNGTNTKGWIRWISVRRWISDTEVEVEQGVFSGPLSGGGEINTYEKIDGVWKLKSSGFSWVS